MKARRILGLALLTAALAEAGWAVASAPRIALVVQGPIDADASLLEARLRAELLVSGFEVLTVPHSGSVDRADLARIAQESGSSAAVSITRTDQFLGAEIWLSRSRNGAAVLQQVRPEPVSPDAPAIVAIRAAEVLRASAIDLRAPAPAASSSEAPAPTVPTHSAVQPPPPAPTTVPDADRGIAATRASSRPWALTAALSALGGPGGVPAGFGPTVALSYTFASAWSLECRGTGPISSSVTFEQGAADVDQELVALDIRFDIDAGEQLMPFVLLGGGAHRTGVRGQASPPNEPLQQSAWTAVGLIETGLRLRASPRWAVRSGVGAFYAASRPVVAVDQHLVAYAGRPGFHGTLGLELGW